MKKFKLIGMAILAMSFASSAMAYKIENKAGSGVSTHLSVSSYTVTGHKVTVTDSQRDVLDYTDGLLTVGEIVEHSVVDVNLNQGGSGVGVGGSASSYSSLAHGAHKVTVSAAGGGSIMNSVDWDNSTILETGTKTTDVDLFDLGGWFPNHVGSETETVYKNILVTLANVDYTNTASGWQSNAIEFE